MVRELTGGCCIDRENERAKVSRGWLARRVALATLVVPHPSGVRPPVGRPENHPRTPTTILSVSLFFTLFLSICLSFLLFFIGLAIYMYRTVRPIDMRTCEIFLSPSHFFDLPSGRTSMRAFPFGNNWDRACFLITLSEVMTVTFNPLRASLSDPPEIYGTNE